LSGQERERMKYIREELNKIWEIEETNARQRLRETIKRGR
jgi:hypothetical protein